jgi:hypothetical protein
VNKKIANSRWRIAEANIVDESNSHSCVCLLFAIKSGRNFIKDIINAKEKKLTKSKILKIYAFIPKISLPK